MPICIYTLSTGRKINSELHVNGRAEGLVNLLCGCPGAAIAMYEAALSGDNEVALLVYEKFPFHVDEPLPGIHDHLDEVL